MQEYTAPEYLQKEQGGVYDQSLYKCPLRDMPNELSLV